ncbi:MAG: FkbM family methyltransferase [Planctomycetes bacterium]|nr:FkbM family methyltransferase [Planctomycetota bacterium]
MIRTAAAVRSPSEHLAAPVFYDGLDLPNGLEFRFPSPMRGAAKFLIREIFHRSRYCRPGFEIRPDDTVIDIGANMGLFSLWAAPQAEHGRVIAIEPTSTLETLEHNARLNLLSHVESVQAAIGRDGETIELEHYPGFNIVTHQRGWRPAGITRALVRLLYGRPGVEPVRVAAPCISLARLMDERDVDEVNFLKIDCEGAEYTMLRDLPTRHWNRIERIAMEFHELHPGHRHQELVAMLRKHGFQVAIRKPWFDYYCMKFGEIWAWR